MDFFSDYTMTIGGDPVSGETWFSVLNPATAEVLAEVPDGSEIVLEAAIASSRAAFPAWSALPLSERRATLLAFADRIETNAGDLARLLVLEQGKPLAEALDEISGAVGYLRAYTTVDLPVETIDDGSGRVAETHHLPVGVVGAIAPWNFPVILAMFKLAPGLLAGNAMVLKPSPFTPLTTLKLGELSRGVLPPGVLNIVTGGDRLGPWMTAHPGFDKISFTGSTATGRKVMETVAPTLKRLTLELGGNDAAIVLPDVDVHEVVPRLFWSAFANNGQICIATKRVYIHDDVYSQVSDGLVEFARSVAVGNGLEQGNLIGPINNRAQYERVTDLIADSLANGHKFLTGGEPAHGPGYFIPITLIDNPPEDSRIVREEQFGPVLPLLRFSDLDDVVRRANDSDYGLGGSVWSADEQAAIALARRLATGNVWINDTQYLSPLATFGGHKQSGIGSEGGLAGLLEYTVPQTIIRTKAAITACPGEVVSD